jgi:hypothetical protein
MLLDALHRRHGLSGQPPPALPRALRYLLQNSRCRLDNQHVSLVFVQQLARSTFNAAPAAA